MVQVDAGGDNTSPKGFFLKKGDVEKYLWKTVCECKTLRSLIQKVFHRNATSISQKKYDNSRIEYGDIVKVSVIPQDTDATLNEVCNVYTNQKYLNPDLKMVERKQIGYFWMMQKLNNSRESASKVK